MQQAIIITGLLMLMLAILPITIAIGFNLNLPLRQIDYMFKVLLPANNTISTSISIAVVCLLYTLSTYLDVKITNN